MRYVERLDFNRDEVLGIFDRRLRLLAMAHLAYARDECGDASSCAEFGVSVAPEPEVAAMANDCSTSPYCTPATAACRRC